jgi:hypothetical protein
MKLKSWIRNGAAAVAFAWLLPAHADVIMDWNAQGDAIAAELRLPPTPHARALALMHLAMFESLNAIDRRYHPFRLDLVTDRNTSREAAAAVAGHAVLLALFPARQAELDALLSRTLGEVPEGPAKQRALLLGRKAAVDLLALRADDHSDASESWRPITQAGMYIPTVIPVGSTFGGYQPWVLATAAQFRPAPPPSLTSEIWTRDLNEIREVGGLKSGTRTAEQTTIAKFWYLNGPRTYNPLIQQVAQAKKLDLLDCSRLYALASLAAADAFIAVFEAKYHYNFWRPVTAIRNADWGNTDQAGNPATPRDASWLPLGETPMHPEYPCAHCISSAAVATVLIALAGDEFAELTLTSAAAPGVTRRWTRISAYRDEVSNARIWAGFHYRFSTEVAKDMGRRIGELTVTTQLKLRGRK